jgi:hypothetical protein
LHTDERAEASAEEPRGMNLKAYFQSRMGEDLHLRLQNSAEIDGRVEFVGDDIIGIETEQNTTMIVPFSAIAFTRCPTSAVKRFADQQAAKQ